MSGIEISAFGWYVAIFMAIVAATFWAKAQKYEDLFRDAMRCMERSERLMRKGEANRAQGSADERDGSGSRLTARSEHPSPHPVLREGDKT
jgi:hypothetical protein